MKKCWAIIKNPNRIKNLPPYTTIEKYRDEWTEEPYYQIVPDTELVEYNISWKELPDYNRVDDKYRGLCVDINDHGNTTLYMRFKNGNVREIWSCV